MSTHSLFKEVSVDLKLLLKHDFAPVFYYECIRLQVTCCSKDFSVFLYPCNTTQLQLNTNIILLVTASSRVVYLTLQTQAALYLHLRAEHRIIAGQLCAVDGVHGECRWAWRVLTGRVVELEKGLNISTVLVSQGLLILVRPLTDPCLPAFSCVFIQYTCIARGVLRKRDGHYLEILAMLLRVKF